MRSKAELGAYISRLKSEEGNGYTSIDGGVFFVDSSTSGVYLVGDGGIGRRVGSTSLAQGDMGVEVVFVTLRGAVGYFGSGSSSSGAGF